MADEKKSYHNVEQAWTEFKAGDKSTFEILYTHYFNHLFLYCNGRLKNVKLAEDTVADILTELLEMPDPGKIGNLNAWLFTIAKNSCVSILQTNARRQRLLEREAANLRPQVFDGIERKITAGTFENIIRKSLSDDDFEIWNLHQQGYKNTEIAGRTNMKKKTVANRKSMIRQQLKDALSEYIENDI